MHRVQAGMLCTMLPVTMRPGRAMLQMECACQGTAAHSATKPRTLLPAYCHHTPPVGSRHGSPSDCADPDPARRAAGSGIHEPQQTPPREKWATAGIGRQVLCKPPVVSGMVNGPALRSGMDGVLGTWTVALLAVLLAPHRGFHFRILGWLSALLNETQLLEVLLGHEIPGGGGGEGWAGLVASVAHAHGLSTGSKALAGMPRRCATPQLSMEGFEYASMLMCSAQLRYSWSLAGRIAGRDMPCAG